VPQVCVILRQRFFSRDAEVQKLGRNDHIGISLLGLVQVLYAEQSFPEVLSFTNQRRLVHSLIHIQGPPKRRVHEHVLPLGGIANVIPSSRKHTDTLLTQGIHTNDPAPEIIRRLRLPNGSLE
jgi:hypothetical protein